MWKIEFYTTQSGKSPISDYIYQLPLPQQSKIRNALNLLKEFGPLLREPHSKRITGYKDLYELRTSGSSPARLFYVHKDNRFMVLHAFVKKTNRTPNKELRIAAKRYLLI